MRQSAKVLVDSSVWIDFLRGEKQAADNLPPLMKTDRIVICGQVKQEVLQGSRDLKSFQKLENQISVFEYVPEGPEDFILAARIFATQRWQGATIPPSDCLIAAVAIRLNAVIYSHDPDFEQIPEVKLYSMVP
jgi:predicted nucleic acid-binding protein